MRNSRRSRRLGAPALKRAITGYRHETGSVLAQSKSEVIYWPASTLSGYSATLKGRQTEKNGEIRGPKHVGGKSQKVTAGDVRVIPPGVAHQTIVDPGKFFFTLIVKVQR